MTLDQIKAFVVIAEELQITRAANRLHIAQPALSRKLKDLEYFLNVVLVKRVPVSLRLTEAGERFLVDARKIIEACEHVKGNLRLDTTFLKYTEDKRGNRKFVVEI